jgi:APA family basic amino acid/polyamine antiporter
MPQVLPRRIAFWSAAAILVGRTIGAGIFRSPASIVNQLPAKPLVLGAWVAGGILALCGALTLAEVASAFPETGGIYVFIREGWGRLPAFLYGWSELVIIRAAGLAAVSTAFTEYFLHALGHTPPIGRPDPWVHYVAAGAIAVIGWLNYRGVRWGTLLQNSTTLIKCGGLLTLILIALVLGHQSTGPQMVSPAAPATLGVVPFGLALISVLWVYNGWADVSLVAGEVKDPTRNLPRVLILGTLFVMALYVLANIAYFKVLSTEELRHSPLVAAAVADRLVGQPGVVAIGIVVMFSTLGTLNGSMLTGPRALWAMAHDGLLFKQLASVHPRYETPHVAILVTTQLGMLFVSLRTFEQLAATVVTASLPFYALAVSAVFLLRQKAGYHPSFRTIGYPVTPLLFIATTLYLVFAAFANPAARVPTAIIFLVVLAGIPLYWTFVKTGVQEEKMPA